MSYLSEKEKLIKLREELLRAYDNHLRESSLDRSLVVHGKVSTEKTFDFLKNSSNNLSSHKLTDALISTVLAADDSKVLEASSILKRDMKINKNGRK